MANDLEATISEVSRLHTSSLHSLLLMAAGVLMVAASSYYSFTRLDPLQRQLEARQAEIVVADTRLQQVEQQLQGKRSELQQAEQRLQELSSETKLLIAKNDELVQSIEQLDAKLSELKTRANVSDSERRAVAERLDNAKKSAVEVDRLSKSIFRKFKF